MASDKLKLFARISGFLFSYLFTFACQRVQALHHQWTYKVTDCPKNVVVIGGSFGGLPLARRLMETLPTGYRVVLLEKNSHFNYSFNFPRYSVLQGSEHLAFIPYDGITKGAPAGIFKLIRGTAKKINYDHVELVSGQKVHFSYLAIATGSSQPLPAKVTATDREEAMGELRRVQHHVQDAQKIAVVGGGAVGIELAADVKSFYPDKDVLLVHSRDQLLPHFRRRLHDYVMDQFHKLGVRVFLGERPHISDSAVSGHQKTLRFSDGKEEAFDLIIPCTGQRVDASFLVDLAPEVISKETSRILVAPTLQLAAPNCQHIFALGDVAETGGPRMARAAWFQSDVVGANILALIHNRRPTQHYTPKQIVEGAIKLTLGKSHWVAYTLDYDGRDFMFSGEDSKLDLEVEKAWWMFGADLKNQKAEVRALDR